MNIEIVERRENPLLERSELRLRILHLGAPTPGRLDVRRELASILGVPEEVIAIEKLAGLPKRCETIGIARVYTSKEKMEPTELKHLLSRGMPKEKPETAEKPKEGKDAEKGEGEKV
ncbi:MAG: 30S ribosomal protein S24e [Candidatus Hadarchaeales archaeon]